MISVCMPTYNGSQYIAKQVESILSQLSPEDELIVSDDGSTDDTIAILQSFQDARIKIFHHAPVTAPYSGALKTAYLINRNMENALKHASGDIIFLADQDDIWSSNKVQCVLKDIRDYDLIIHSYQVIDANGDYKYTARNVRQTKTFVKTICKPSFKGCCMAFTAKLKNHALPFPNYAVEHDTWIGLCAIKYGRIKYTNDILLSYRRHENNVSPESGKSKNSFYIRLKRRFFMLKAYYS